MSSGIIPYRSDLRTRARELRHRMTLAEVLLWNELKARQMQGVSFHRQVPLGDCIADFYCKELRLAIEVDGRSHDAKEQKDRDRDARLAALGVDVLRVWNHHVKHDMPSVLAAIATKIEEIRARG